jgi:hypothetical protein
MQHHHNCTNCQKATEEKDGFGNWAMSIFVETI